jgi:hypothetical protein
VERSKNPEALKLLEELGILTLGSESEIRDKIETLNMRQLDRLKLLLVRATATLDNVSDETKSGIRRNDYASFTQAIVILKHRYSNEKA